MVAPWAVNCPHRFVFLLDGCEQAVTGNKDDLGQNTRAEQQAREWRCCQARAGLNLHKSFTETLAGTAGEDGVCELESWN